ncbi:MAG: tryptophan 7-halogenase [Blastocatellia bacterium]
MRSTTDTLAYDVVILGGGPAGTATALSLARHNPELSIAIIEASEYDRPRIGETLVPIAQSLLMQLGVWERFNTATHLTTYGTCSAWGSDELAENEFIYTPHNRGWHLDRRSFDAMLASAAVERGVTLLTGAMLSGSQRTSDGNWLLRIHRKNAPAACLTTKFVVDATGRRASFARQQGARKRLLDHLLGVFVFFKHLDEQATVEQTTLVEACEQGWWYAARLPDARMVVACMSDADIVRQYGLKSPPQWLDHLCKTHHVRGRLRHAEPLMRPAALAAYSHRLEPLTGEGWLAAGDAATTFDPLSSQGIFKALRSGLLASFAILDYFKGNRAGLARYAAALAREYESYLETRLEYYGRERRWPHSPFWQRRHSAASPDTLLPSQSAL